MPYSDLTTDEMGENMFEILNEMIELIYIADVETYELLFMNTIGKERFKLDKLDGLKCYKILQGLDAPCPFCTNAKLSLDETYSWSITNSVNHCHYLLKDKLIVWNGRVARIEIAIDDSESENEKIALKNALEGEQIVMECAKQLYHTADIYATVCNVLGQIGAFLKAERAYIFDIRDNKMFNTYEWCAEGVQPQVENLQDLDVSLIDGWMPYFNRQECVIFDSLDEMKWDNLDTYHVLARQGIRSLVAAPLEKDGEIVGYIGVDNPPCEKVINIAPLFRTLCYFLMTTMRRAEDEEKLSRLSYYDMLTGFYNRNRFIQDIAQLVDYEGSVGVAYLDINGLKDINDHFGHTRGDQILFLCARKMAEAFGLGDFYRIGGDEFLVICRDMNKNQFVSLTERMKTAFDVDSECCAAVGHQWAETGSNIQSLISKADAMMYKSKEEYYRKNPATSRYRKWE